MQETRANFIPTCYRIRRKESMPSFSLRLSPRTVRDHTLAVAAAGCRKFKTAIARYSASWRATLPPARDAAVLVPPNDVTTHIMFCSLFLFNFFPTVSPKWHRLSFFLFFPGFFLYFLLCVNSLDKDFRNIVRKNYIEHCAYKVYDELVCKKMSEKSS